MFKFEFILYMELKIQNVQIYLGRTEATTGHEARHVSLGRTFAKHTNYEGRFR